MSNADDRCMRPECGYPRSFHGPGYSTNAGCCDAFLESREDALARRARYQVSVRLATLRASAPQPASGDEAKVREIADDIYRRLWKGDHDPLVQHTLLPAAVAAGRTLGREDASKECEGIAVEEMCGSKRTLSERLTGKRIVEAIIARRGSEGK